MHDHTGLIAGLCFVCAGLAFVTFSAPHMPTPNRCRRFILIWPLHHVDPWNEKKEKEEEEDEHVPWWFNVGAYCVIIACMEWPILGWVVLLVVTMWMMYRFIQKITETGPYAQTQEGEQSAKEK